jgi:nitroreductase
MEVTELIEKNRSCRRFRENEPVDRKLLERLVNLARLSPSGGNKQPLKFIIENSPEKNSMIFPHLSWAGYIRDWKGPEEGERPSAYIIILHDSELSETSGVDHGIAAQSILLGAVDAGLRGCIIGSVDRDSLSSELELEERYRILLVISLGFPGEEVRLEETGQDGDIRYWRDEQGIHHVPKRPLEELILTQYN